MSAVQPMPSVAQTQAESAARTRVLTALTAITVISILFGLYLALFAIGEDTTQGNVQRIFYLHVSSFAGAFVAFGATVFAAIAYLRTRSAKWDGLAIAGVEVGLVLGLMNLVTGATWARPIWNTWWTWDPRLTADAIMCLTYFAYLMLRQGIENIETRRRFASVYGILAFSTAVITLIITRIRPDTIHPIVIGPSPANAEGGFSLDLNMGTVLSYNMVVWSVLVPWVLIWWRIRLENLSQRVQARRAHMLEQ